MFSTREVIKSILNMICILLYIRSILVIRTQHTTNRIILHFLHKNILILPNGKFITGNNNERESYKDFVSIPILSRIIIIIRYRFSPLNSREK